MAVVVSPINAIVKPGSLVTRVTDTFNRGTLNPSGQLIWAHNPFLILPITNPITIGDATCPNTSQLNLSASQNGGGTNGTYYTTILPCVGLTFSAVNGVTQYCQATFQGFGGGTNFTACGNMVMGSWNGIQGGQWYGVVHRNAGLTAVEKASVSSNVLGNTILFTDIAPVAGDVWRLSFNTATNTLTATKNGTVVYSAVDASPLVGGIPGFAMRSVSQALGVNGSVLVSNADLGVGL